MGCDQYFPSQPFVVLTVDQFVRRRVACLNDRNRITTFIDQKTGTLPLIFRRNQSRHYINDKV